MPATIGVVSAILGWPDASLAVGPLLPREQPRGGSEARERGSGEAKNRSGEGSPGAADTFESPS